MESIPMHREYGIHAAICRIHILLRKGLAVNLFVIQNYETQILKELTFLDNSFTNDSTAGSLCGNKRIKPLL